MNQAKRNLGLLVVFLLFLQLATKGMANSPKTISKNNTSQGEREEKCKSLLKLD
jgi:hypothetical protein